nr:MAG TPA: hypothetical protein [Caudoviricetes sp.]
MENLKVHNEYTGYTGGTQVPVNRFSSVISMI